MTDDTATRRKKLAAVRYLVVLLFGLSGLLIAAPPCRAGSPSGERRLVVWAWERPEDLRFLPPDVEIAALSGFIDLRGDRMVARGRRFPLFAAPKQVSTSVVHVQVNRSERLAWTPQLREETAAAVIALANHIPARRIQIDFEARPSERQALFDLVGDVKRRLSPGVELSVTALASWCQTEDWTSLMGADEIVPMLFRMGPWGASIRTTLASGGDFSQADCRRALAISTDSPITSAPVARRIYLFNPKSWTRQDFERIRGEVEGWRAKDGPVRSPQD